MSVLPTYSCDMCPATKQDSNHWFVVVEQDDALKIYYWKDAQERGLLDRGKHLCGRVCMNKLTNAWMDREPVAAEPESAAGESEHD